MYHGVATWRGLYVQDRDAPAGSQPRSARRPPHAAAAPLALCTAVASKKKDVPEQQRAFAIKPVLEQATRSFRKVMGTLFRARRDFLGVVVVAELCEGGLGALMKDPMAGAAGARAASAKTETTSSLLPTPAPVATLG